MKYSDFLLVMFKMTFKKHNKSVLCPMLAGISKPARAQMQSAPLTEGINADQQTFCAAPVH